MVRQTKIIGTLGPKSSEEPVIRAMIDAGIDLVRHNLSHATIAEHCRHARLVKQLTEGRKAIGQIFDLQGPKLRIERFREAEVFLEEGLIFTLDCDHDPYAGDRTRVSVAYDALPSQVAPGNRLLVDDGRIVLDVKEVRGSEIVCTVVDGGVLSDRKGINLQGGGLAAPALTDTDKVHIETAVHEVAPDYFAVSFVTDATDVEEARRLIQQAGGSAGVIAKIERRQALDNLEAIIQVSDAVMVARGDLGVEIGDAALPAVQKRILRTARALSTPVITATQMMESMIHCPVPTRAEVFDVANAVSGGTDAVMLSAETATGRYPARVIAKISEICEQAEAQPEARIVPDMDAQYPRIDETIAMAAMYAAHHYRLKAVLALTESGNTTLWMSRVTSCTDLPIYALTPSKSTLGRVALYRSVHPIEFVSDSQDYTTVIRQAVSQLIERKLLSPEDSVLVTKGVLHCRGGTNSLEIVKVADVVANRNDGSPGNVVAV